MRFTASSIATLLVIGMLQAVQADDKVTDAKQRIEQSTAQVESFQQKLDAIEATKEDKQVKSVQPWTQKMYRVADLVERQHPDKKEVEPSAAELIPIMKFIQTRVAPTTWGRTLAGNAEIAIYAQNHSLVIFQSNEVHEKIHLELTKLRDAYQVLDEFDQISTHPSFPAP